MTREEAIEIIKCDDISNRWGKDGEEVEKMAIKALEQDNILDKIRAEIDQYLFQNEFGSAYRKEVSQIIDKYRSESEVDS